MVVVVSCVAARVAALEQVHLDRYMGGDLLVGTSHQNGLLGRVCLWHIIVRIPSVQATGGGVERGFASIMPRAVLCCAQCLCYAKYFASRITFRKAAHMRYDSKYIID